MGGRRKFRVNEEDLGHINFQELLKKENVVNEVLIEEEEEAEDTLQAMDSVRRHSFVGHVNRSTNRSKTRHGNICNVHRMKERFEVKAETHERRGSRSADRDQRGRTFTSSVAARIQETTKALQALMITLTFNVIIVINVNANDAGLCEGGGKL